MPKLNQIVAIEKGVKSRVYGEITELHKVSQKPDLFNGFSKVYKRQDDAGETYPAERKIVQIKADDLLRKVSRLLAELIDVTATKDLSNCQAKADIRVNGTVLATGIPSTHLLFLEKQLTDLRTFIDKLPVLDEADEWDRDEAAGIYKTEAISTQRTKKLQRPIVLYPATTEHPAQTQLITEDVLVGYWDTIKHSGAIPGTRKAELLERVDTVLNAVKFSLAEANNAEAPDIKIGEQILNYLFA